MLTTGAPPNILIRANIYNNDPIRYIVLVVSCFVLPIPNIYRDTSVLIPVLTLRDAGDMGNNGIDGVFAEIPANGDGVEKFATNGKWDEVIVSRYISLWGEKISPGIIDRNVCWAQPIHAGRDRVELTARS